MKPERRRQLGLGTGIVLGAAAVASLNARGCETFHARGPMNSGHATLACGDCHREAPGTVRQQLQAAASATLLSATDAPVVDVGYREVTNTECLACHVRTDDRHPVFRFLEPRFAAARDALHPERCESCHREHAGVRITIVEQTYCRHCHAETALDDDPLDVTHRELVATQRWDSCLGCHDFHGNHAMKAPRRLADRIPAAQTQAYFDGGPSPYGPAVRRATQQPKQEGTRHD
jgi:hypothetical protein